ncbi:glycine-rich protein 5-like [Oryza glaberrima]|uniref:glycine-rich protein 5-like n=1 Tax=Oryza glaberrima TaxID=4538 RepID=UPI00224BF0E0|nr:glycine-rich protein 5-like [Oryza glaberrima]
MRHGGDVGLGEGEGGEATGASTRGEEAGGGVALALGGGTGALVGGAVAGARVVGAEAGAGVAGGGRRGGGRLLGGDRWCGGRLHPPYRESISEELLENIVSRISLCDVVLTSAVSRSWIHRWESAPNLRH